AVQRSGSATGDPPARKSDAAARADVRRGLAGLCRSSNLFRSGGALTAGPPAPQSSSRSKTSAAFARPRQPAQRTDASEGAVKGSIALFVQLRRRANRDGSAARESTTPRAPAPH